MSKKIHLKKKTLVVVIFIAIIAILFLLSDEDTSVRTDVKIAFKTEEVFMNEDELSLEIDARNSLNNLVVNAMVNHQWMGNMITGKGDNIAISSSSLTYIENGYIIVIDGLLEEGERHVTVTCQESGKTVTGSFYVVFSSSKNDPSTGKGLNIYHGPAHTSEERNIEGVINGTVDGTSMDKISGTPAGEEVIANDPNLNYDENGNLQNDSSLPEQEVEEVIPSNPEPTPTPEPNQPEDDQTTVEEGTPVEPETPSADISKSVGSVCVVSNSEDDECAYTLWGDGEKTAVGTAEELGLQDLGNGLVNSIFGILRKN